MIARGHNVSVNTIIGLLFMQGMEMILDLVDNLVECKHLNCLLFPVDFRRMSDHIPVTVNMLGHFEKCFVKLSISSATMMLRCKQAAQVSLLKI